MLYWQEDNNIFMMAYDGPPISLLPTARLLVVLLSVVFTTRGQLQFGNIK